jgi:hypothetical protein
MGLRDCSLIGFRVKYIKGVLDIKKDIYMFLIMENSYPSSFEIQNEERKGIKINENNIYFYSFLSCSLLFPNMKTHYIGNYAFGRYYYIGCF